MLVTALDSALPSEGLSASIVYIPEGVHTIRPTVDGKPQTITVKMEPNQGERIAASFQAQLEKIQAGNVRPFMDFDHSEGAASALPKRFFYEKGKGLMLEVEWTGKGRQAIEGKDYSYFSPTFYKAEDGTPTGIPERGPLGSLVNSPAFREIPRIAASQAKDPDNPNYQTDMSKLILAALNVNAADANAEDSALAKIDAMKKQKMDLEEKIKSMQSEYGKMKDKAEAAEAKVAAANKSRAESLVKAAVADGRIAPKDEDKQAKFIERIEAGDTFAEEVLAELPKAHGDLETPLVTAGAEKTGSTEGRIQAAQAKARAELGDSADFQAVWARATEIDPSAFEN
jgi:phage I-like protein